MWQDQNGIRGVVHLVNESFTSFHVDADEHVSHVSRAMQLSLGIPLGCLGLETAGLVIPGARDVFTFTAPGLGANTDALATERAEERLRRERLDHLRTAIGHFFTFRLQIELRLDHNLMMMGGSIVKPRHVQISNVKADGFCLIRALHHPDEMSQREMRDIVRNIVSTSLQAPGTFIDRVINLECALSTYMTSVEDAVPTWVRCLSEDLEKLHTEDDRLLNTVAYMPQDNDERAQWDVRIIEACTRNKDDTSSYEGDGLLLWLCEGELGALARRYCKNIRCWQTSWLETINPSSGAKEYDVDFHRLIAVHHAKEGDSSPTPLCIDIVHAEDHFSRLRFVQDRFHRLQLNVLDFPSLRKDQVNHLGGLLSELSALHGSTIAPNILEALKRTTGPSEGLVWKTRGTGVSGSRLSSEAPLPDMPPAKRTRSHHSK